MDTNCTPIPRYFNETVAKAKSHYVDSLNRTYGQYTADGYGRIETNGYDNETRYYDNNHDGWVDEKIVNKYGEKVILQNTNPKKDNMFDIYTEYQNNRLSRTAMDRDKNGKFDVVEVYEDSAITQRIEDINGDNEPDLYTFYTDEGMKKIDTRGWFQQLTDKLFGREKRYD